MNEQRFHTSEAVLNTVLGAALGSAVAVSHDSQKRMPVGEALGGIALFFLLAFLVFALVWFSRKAGRQIAARQKLSARYVVAFVVLCLVAAFVPSGVPASLQDVRYNAPLGQLLLVWLPMYCLIGKRCRK